MHSKDAFERLADEEILLETDSEPYESVISNFIRRFREEKPTPPEERHSSGLDSPDRVRQTHAIYL